MQHRREPLRALREVRRILAPGGLPGLRDDDWGAYFWEPRNPLLKLGMEIVFKVWRFNGGDPFYPRHQRRLLPGHGKGEPKLGRVSRRAQQRSCLLRTVLEQGLADQATLMAIYDAMSAWGEHPDAYQAVMMCEAIGWADEAGPGSV